MSTYIDNTACLQVIGGIYNNPSLIDDDKLFFNEDDFTEKFHKIIFGSIYNLYLLGAKEITINTIEDYLKDKPKSYAIYQANKGAEWLNKVSSVVQVSTFQYYYQRMKKMTLLRMYNKSGVDLSWLYDVDNILDIQKKEKQEEWLDNTSLEKIADLVDTKINEVRAKYVNDDYSVSVQAGTGITSLLEKFKKSPEFGVPLYGKLINTITRGARLGKFYLQSAGTGVGKSRSMVANSCYIACSEMYDVDNNEWIKIGSKEPTLFITTEQDEEEIQTMMIAFIAGVDEELIIKGIYTDETWARVSKAAKILEESPLYIKKLPDFSLEDIEMSIKSGIREHGVKYIFHDYIHTSMKILSEISSKAKVKNLREDNILFMISVRLKDICTQYGVFIMSATQLNGEYRNSEVYDQNLLRGAKSIADKIDFGSIMLEVTKKDLDALEVLLTNNGIPKPSIKISIYKNRRGKYKGILLWCRDNRNQCKIEPMFATNYNYEFIEMEDTQIEILPNLIEAEPSAF